MSFSLETLQHRIQYTFRDVAVLKQALRHKSLGHNNNERLEFLGDAILNAVMSGLLFERLSGVNEGALSRYPG